MLLVDSSIGNGRAIVKDMDAGRWLVDIFIQYQESLDKQREKRGHALRFKDALESDRLNRSRGHNSASSIDVA